MAHLLARVLIYGAGWFLTATFFINMFDWADNHRPKRYSLNQFAGITYSLIVWAIILGLIYW